MRLVPSSASWLAWPGRKVGCCAMIGSMVSSSAREMVVKIGLEDGSDRFYEVRPFS